MHCRDTERNLRCEQQGTSTPPICEAFDVCLPFGKALHWDGECLRVSGSPTLPDGEYGSITVQGGCIVDAHPAPVFEYTPPPCNPSAEPCTGGDGVTLSPSTDNLSRWDAAGRLLTTVVIQGQGIDVSGYGTVASPFILALPPVEAQRTYISSGSLVLEVAGEGGISDPYIVSHKTSPAGGSTLAGFTLDSFGHVVSYANPAGSAITNIVAGPGITVDQQGSIVTLSGTPTTSGAGQWVLGAYRVTTDLMGRMTDVTQLSGVSPGVYDGESYAFTVNETGTVTAVTPSPRMADNRFSKAFSGARDTTSMSITTAIEGHVRVTYRGDLGSATGSTVGLVPLPSGYSLQVNGTTVAAQAVVVGGRVTEVHAINYPRFSAGTHTITMFGPVSDAAAFNDTGIMDVEIIELGV